MSPRVNTSVRAAASAVLLPLLASFACAAGSAAGPADGDGESGHELRLSLSTGDESPRAATPIVLELAGVNEGQAALILDFPDGQRYDFEVISEDGAVVWRWAEGRFFAQVLGRETLEPGASLNWTATIEAGLPAGVYRVLATLTTVEPHTIEATLTVLPRR
ncbi:BsuPI-related putative proteinase inhibitor [Candidatus Palauibacter sp.]|uniref:BsuPI-related putative proteinase inhibitor n=1 Tax=Candidatus Palauibacter sp. TaxID=3101350 RepID=UPI003B01D271